jgi:hypothetical protein
LPDISLQKEVFLSYNHQDRVLAGQVRNQLEALGYAAFLAHDDIEVSAQWREEILRHLESCSGLISVVTENFGRSAWANQEVGFILGKNKPVASLIFGEASQILPGFLASLQGIPASEATISMAVIQAIKPIEEAGSASKADPVVLRLSAILNSFVRRWESFQRLSENERYLSSRDGGARDETLRNVDGYAEELFQLLSTSESFLEPGVAHQANVVFDMMKKFSRSRIMTAGRSDYDEMEQKGRNAYDAANALLTYLKTKPSTVH